MSTNNAIACSLVILSGAIVFGCGVIAESVPGGRPGTAEWAIGVGCALGIIGLVSLWAECAGKWGVIKSQLGSLQGKQVSSNKKPVAEQAND